MKRCISGDFSQTIPLLQQCSLFLLRLDFFLAREPPVPIGRWFIAHLMQEAAATILLRRSTRPRKLQHAMLGMRQTAWIHANAAPDIITFPKLPLTNQHYDHCV